MKNIPLFLVLCLLSFSCSRRGDPASLYLKSKEHPERWLVSESDINIIKFRLLNEIQCSIFHYNNFKRRFAECDGVVEYCIERLNFLDSFRKEVFSQFESLGELVGESSFVFHIYYFYDEKDFEEGFVILNEEGIVLHEEWFNSDGPE